MQHNSKSLEQILNAADTPNDLWSKAYFRKKIIKISGYFLKKKFDSYRVDESEKETMKWNTWTLNTNDKITD